MKLLVIAPDYPKPGRLFGGIFNQRSVAALAELCEKIEVLAPRPFAPPIIASLIPRWKVHAATPGYQIVDGIPVYRPKRIQIPRLGGAFCHDLGAFLCCRRIARNMHRRVGFDAILSFDLVLTGGLAWRLGKELSIPATGWATGGDVRVRAMSSYGRALIRTLKSLDSVFYQSNELLTKASELVEMPSSQLHDKKHAVLPRGIPMPPSLVDREVRRRQRLQLGIQEDQILILNIGRIEREKGVLELMEAVSMAAMQDPRVICVMIGSSPAYDETAVVQQKLGDEPELAKAVKLLSACTPDKVWDYLCAADIFAFTSHHEGMPNSLLEAMAMGVPAVAFAIPAVLEIEAGMGAPVLVPPLDSKLFSDAILRLASSPKERACIGKRGRERVAERYMVNRNMALAVERLKELIDRGKDTNRSKQVGSANLIHQR